MNTLHKRHELHGGWPGKPDVQPLKEPNPKGEMLDSIFGHTPYQPVPHRLDTTTILKKARSAGLKDLADGSRPWQLVDSIRTEMIDGYLVDQRYIEFVRDPEDPTAVIEHRLGSLGMISLKLDGQPDLSDLEANIIFSRMMGSIQEQARVSMQARVFAAMNDTVLRAAVEIAKFGETSRVAPEVSETIVNDPAGFWDSKQKEHILPDAVFANITEIIATQLLIERAHGDSELMRAIADHDELGISGILHDRYGLPKGAFIRVINDQDFFGGSFAEAE